MRIVIVGGVAGGMSAAARARRLDEQAEIIVLERGQYPSFANCGLPYHVSGEIADADKLLVQTPASLKAALNLDVRIGHTVTAVDAFGHTVTVDTPTGTETIGYDQLILAPGARATVPPVPGLADGLDAGYVSRLRTVEDAQYLREQAVAEGSQRAVVLGAGFIGLEAAEGLAIAGLQVDVVDLAAHVLPPLERETATPVTNELRRLGIGVHTGIGAARVDSSSRTVELTDGSVLPADFVVLAAGVAPDTDPFLSAGIGTDRGAIIVDELGHTTVNDIWAVGDAAISVDAVTGLRRPVPLAGPANRAGRLVAEHLLDPGTAQPIPRPLGTAIIRVGNLTAAMTGANRGSLEEAGIAYQTVHLHVGHHADYFPGAEQMHLLAHFDPASGKLLGAQGVGPEGVDKRIDVLATALRFGATMADLIDLDLAYSPIYGSAKDPVNLLGMLGENVRTGGVAVWQAGDLAEIHRDAVILDVRSKAEWDTGHLPGALHIPHTQVREHLDDIRAAAAGRPVRVHCQSGKRSNLAVRILTGEGFDAAHLSGGILTLRQWFGDHAGDVLTAPEAVSA